MRTAPGICPSLALWMPMMRRSRASTTFLRPPSTCSRQSSNTEPIGFSKVSLNHKVSVDPSGASNCTLTLSGVCLSVKATSLLAFHSSCLVSMLLPMEHQKRSITDLVVHLSLHYFIEQLIIDCIYFLLQSLLVLVLKSWTRYKPLAIR